MRLAIVALERVESAQMMEFIKLKKIDVIKRNAFFVIFMYDWNVIFRNLLIRRENQYKSLGKPRKRKHTISEGSRVGQLGHLS